MSDDERIEQLELEVKVLRANNEGLKAKIEELKNITKSYDSFLGAEKIVIADKKFFVNGYFQENFVRKDKIKAKIEEVKDGTYDAKIVLQSLLEKE